MAQSGGRLCAEQLQCSICLDVFTNPASTPCGHSFCMACIGRFWDGSRVCRCPLCKEVFSARPRLHINRTLKGITELVKGTPGRAGRPEPLPAPDRALEGLALADSRGPLCQKHHRRLDLFCKTDDALICEGCLETHHEGHTIALTSREWLISKSQLGTSQAEIQEMIRYRVVKVEELRTSLDGFSTSTGRETQSSMRALKALASSVESAQAKLLEVIQMNRLAAEQQAQGLVEDLEREISQLRKRNDMLTQLSLAEDYTLMLKHFPTLCTPPQTKDWSGVSVNSDLCVEGIGRTVSLLTERFQEELQRLPEMSIRFPVEASPVRLQPKEIKMQDYAVEVTFDDATAHPKLVLSEDRKQVWCGDKLKTVPDNQERFDRMICVLGREGFTGGKHYWEVGVAGKTDWDIGVAIHSNHRKGKLTVTPGNGYWFLSLRDNNNFNIRPSTSGAQNRIPHVIGVFLDYERGQVSFYNVGTQELIHTFTDTFSKTVYPFFSPCGNKSGRNEAPLVITPVH